MKKLMVFVMFISVVSLNFAANIDSINEDVNVILQQEKSDSEIDITPKTLSSNKGISQQENHPLEKSLQKQAEEIPIVFGQWWFWVGLFVLILFLKLVIFKK
jgi:hypothetical protein